MALRTWRDAIWNLLEGHFEWLLVNAQHIKTVPGRKTDAKDCEWIAELLQHGLLRGSFVPPEPIRELRDLKRNRTILVQQRATVLNRIEKVLEDANIKLASVASRVLGQSGRTMLQAMVHGILDPNKLAEMAKAKLRNKIPELRLAFGGRFEERHRFKMQELLDQMHFLDDKVAEFAQQIEQRSQPWNEHIQRLMTIPVWTGSQPAACWRKLGTTWINSQPPNILPPGPEFVPATKRVPVNATAAKRAKLPLAPASSALGLDLNRNIGQPKKITTIFGRKVTKQYEGKLPSVIEDLDLPNRVIRSHYGPWLRQAICARRSAPEMHPRKYSYAVALSC